MEKMPYTTELDLQVIQPSVGQVITSDWQRGLPVLTGEQVRLRELRASDAPSLFSLLTTQEVARFISPPPSTVEGFERFIAWTLRQRTAGTYACFAVTLKDFDTAIGSSRCARRSPASVLPNGLRDRVAVLGTGVFEESAQLVLEFAFDTLDVHRLEARSAVRNGRGTGALLKLGAVPKVFCGSPFSATVSTSIRCCTRLSRTTGARHATPRLKRRRSRSCTDPWRTTDSLLWAGTSCRLIFLPASTAARPFSRCRSRGLDIF